MFILGNPALRAEGIVLETFALPIKVVYSVRGYYYKLKAPMLTHWGPYPYLIKILKSDERASIMIPINSANPTRMNQCPIFACSAFRYA